ncbi:hypothetical protein BDP27DRAFT_1219464 [Rhodocollybia butyracea]|uniref:Small ribosomal subunit protein mS41 n=1 Tax=Rhodocollybia butyracea TaxID=206335 RepID=A0A9P5PRZ3_9AGAR|nr:hypothetical protein BDP27DRAFT_1219464 [Rhodocollybia butyracea]
MFTLATRGFRAHTSSFVHPHLSGLASLSGPHPHVPRFSQFSVLSHPRSHPRLHPQLASNGLPGPHQVQIRTLVNRSLTKPVPPTRGQFCFAEAITTPNEFLKKIGRSLDTKLTSLPDTWDGFWRISGLEMRSAGVGVKDRRYTLWCMAKFRRGIPVEEFAHEEKPKKTVRGWGPAVQNGKRIRSRRIKA